MQLHRVVATTGTWRNRYLSLFRRKSLNDSHPFKMGVLGGAKRETILQQLDYPDLHEYARQFSGYSTASGFRSLMGQFANWLVLDI
jgi:hypothetical protein